MNRYAVMLALPLLVACNVQSSPGDQAGGNVSIRADDSGKVAFNLAVGNGELTIPGLKIDDADFDIDGVRLMPGSHVTGISVDARGEAGTVNIGFTSPASPEGTRAYFVDRFKAEGVRAAVNGDTVTGTTGDGEPFTITVGAAPGGSAGKIAIQSND